MRSGPLVWVSVVIAALIVLWGIASVFAVPLTTWREHGRRRSSWVLMMLLFYGGQQIFNDLGRHSAVLLGTLSLWIFFPTLKRVASSMTRLIVMHLPVALLPDP